MLTTFVFKKTFLITNLGSLILFRKLKKKLPIISTSKLVNSGIRVIRIISVIRIIRVVSVVRRYWGDNYGY